MNKTNKPVVITPTSNQFWVDKFKFLIGIKLIRVHPPASSNGVYATRHFSSLELNILNEPVDEMILLNNSCWATGSNLLYDLKNSKKLEFLKD